jgi:hypothetical protein
MCRGVSVYCEAAPHARKAGGPRGVAVAGWSADTGGRRGVADMSGIRPSGAADPPTRSGEFVLLGSIKRIADRFQPARGSFVVITERAAAAAAAAAAACEIRGLDT